MGRPPINGAPSFRFNPVEVAQMESILQKHEGQVPPRDFLVALANKFSNSPERAGKIVVQMKQVWNWFQNRRYALRAKVVKSPGKPSSSPVTRDDATPVRNIPPVPTQTPVTSGPNVVRNASETPQMEFEAKSARDGAWYDVQAFLSHRYLETSNPEVLVRFAGFGPEEDEWVNIRKHVRQRSLPCEASECIAVLAGDLILCFQEGKEQALYFDAHVLDAQRRRHDVRGCRCRFLVRYDHDQSEEIVPLRKVCRRPETDYRLQQLHAANEAASASMSAEPPKPVVDLTSSSTSRMTNPGPSTAATAVHPSAYMGAGPSAPPPATTQIPAPVPSLTSAPVAATVSPLTSHPVRVPAPSPTSAVAVRASTPTQVPNPVPVAPRTATVPVSLPAASTQEQVPAVATAPASAPVTAPIPPAASPIAPTPISAPIAAAVITPPVTPATTLVPPTVAPTTDPVVATVSSAPVTAHVAPAPTVESASMVSAPGPEPEKVESNNPAPVSETNVVESVNPGKALEEVAPQADVTNPVAASLVLGSEKTEVSGSEAAPLTGSGDNQGPISNSPTITVSEPAKIESSTPGGDPALEGSGSVGSEGGNITGSAATNSGNLTAPTEEVKE